MRSPVAATALAAALGLAPVLTDTMPAWSQDFSITNQVEPADARRRDLTRQLQTWWDVHAYYPRNAAANDQSGAVEIRLVVRPDGNVMTIDLVQGSGSPAIDAAGLAVFRAAFVRPFPTGALDASIDVSLHYVLAPRHDQPVVASTTPVASKSAFSVTSDPVKPTVVDTVLQRTCTGTVVTEGWRNHPEYGSRHTTTVIFFRKPDDTPWVKFWE